MTIIVLDINSIVFFSLSQILNKSFWQSSYFVTLE